MSGTFSGVLDQDWWMTYWGVVYWGGIIHVRVVILIMVGTWLILAFRCENWLACRGMLVNIVVPWFGISRVSYW